MRLFGRRSAIDPALLDLLEQAGRNAERASGLLRDMLADFPERSELARDLLLCEQEGDRITHDVMHRLNGIGSTTGIQQADVHALAGAIDDVVDHAEETADLMVIYRIEAPMEQAVAMADILVGASRTLAAAMASLRGGDGLATHLRQIHELENEGDRVSRDAIAALFVGHIDPIVVIRWKDVFESLEDAVDSCETAAHVLEGMALRSRR